MGRADAPVLRTTRRSLLQRFGASLDDVVDEVIYVVDADAGDAAAGPVRKEAYG
jgi:hypothetical protein